MTMRAGRRGGGSAVVRWAYGVVVTLCAALALLVHHEVSMPGVPPMPGMARAAMPSATPAAHVMSDTAAPSVSDPSTHTLDDGGCAGTGMQHCGAANVGSTHLVVPDHSGFPPPVNLPRALSARAPGALVSRAPPDLSVLSQLRI
ncbi:hypothetical protein OK074_5310 [Actinobacteria bacterium OK074]|nr:hypothetical protein OK074_5310 [Actinobacteria bacterium OK074]